MIHPCNRSVLATGLVAALFASVTVAPAQAQDIDAASAAVEAKVIEWRRDIHAHPELGNQEVRTAGWWPST